MTFDLVPVIPPPPRYLLPHFFKKWPYFCVFFFFFLMHYSPLAVKEKLTADPDSEVATTSLRVSLMCPVSVCPLSVNVFIHGFIYSSGSPPLMTRTFFAAWKDASHSAMSSRHLLPPTVFRRGALPADEREETHLDLPSV